MDRTPPPSTREQFGAGLDRRTVTRPLSRYELDSKCISPDELRERACATKLIQHDQKCDVVVLFYTHSLGFATGSDRSIQAFFESYVEIADCDEFTCASCLKTSFGTNAPPLPAKISS